MLAVTIVIGAYPQAPAFAHKCTLSDAEVQRKAEALPCVALPPPRVEYVPTSATLLHWGMSAADVVRIMGRLEEIKTAAVKTATCRSSDIARDRSR
jgi:hypothetical protein